MGQPLNENEESFLKQHRGHDVEHLLGRWTELADRAGWVMETIVEPGGFPVVAVSSGPPAGHGPSLYLSAGIHGDEPAGVAGLLQWTEQHVEELEGMDWVMFPCLNPWGLAQNCRLDEAGRDLNRSFGEPKASPIREWREFVAGRSFDVAAMLHEDYDAQGAYLYELTRRGRRDGERLLERVDPVIPRHAGLADGRRLKAGVMRRTRGIREIAETIDGVPEAIHLYREHAQVTLTFETPSEFSLFSRVEAQMRFLDGVAAMVRGEE